MAGEWQYYTHAYSFGQAAAPMKTSTEHEALVLHEFAHFTTAHYYTHACLKVQEVIDGYSNVCKTPDIVVS